MGAILVPIGVGGVEARPARSGYRVSSGGPVNPIVLPSASLSACAADSTLCPEEHATAYQAFAGRQSFPLP